MKYAILISAALGLSACASNGLQLSASQCAADWRSVGVADGAEGAPETKINQYRSACAGTSPLAASDIAAWKRGWADGADIAVDIDDEPATYEVAKAHDHTHSHGGHSHRTRPVISPHVSVGVGSRGVRGGVGLGVGFGLFRLGLGLGF